MQTLTFGDFLTLPSVPGVLWQVADLRSIENAGDPWETRAELRPFHPGPDADNPTEGATPWGYDEPVRIGRAERVGVTIGLRPDRYGDAPTLRPIATTRTYSENLTAAQSALLEREAGDVFAFSFILPPLTPEEIRGWIVGQVTGGYEASHAARETIKSAPNMYHLRGVDGAPGVAGVIRDAFDNEEGAEALRLALDEATELYRAALRKELLTFGRVGQAGTL